MLQHPQPAATSCLKGEETYQDRSNYRQELQKNDAQLSISPTKSTPSTSSTPSTKSPNPFPTSRRRAFLPSCPRCPSWSKFLHLFVASLLIMASLREIACTSSLSSFRSLHSPTPSTHPDPNCEPPVEPPPHRTYATETHSSHARQPAASTMPPKAAP